MTSTKSPSGKTIIEKVIAGVIVAALLGGIGWFVAGRNTKPSPQPINVTTTQISTVSANTAPAKDSIRTPNCDVRKLIEIIKNQQSMYVRESYGEAAGECFSNDDSKTFFQSDIPSAVKSNLLKDNEYLCIVASLFDMDQVARQQLLKLARTTYKKTWAELGAVTRDGQTTAGQQAEKSIANAVVDLTNRLLLQNKEIVLKMMQGQ